MTQPVALLDAAAVAGRLPDAAVVQQALREAFAQLATGSAVQPSQTVLPLADGASDVIVYSAATARPSLVAVKASPYLAHRPPSERVSAWTLLVSTSDGRPVLLCDSAALTVERTAGTTALAVDALAPTDATTLGVIGAGPVALAHLRHLVGLRGWSRIRISSPALAAGDDVRTAAVRALPFDVEVVSDPAELGRASDVVCLCTSAAAPVLSLADTRPDVLVTSVSTNAPGAHEVAPEDVASCAVYVDSRAAAPRAATELRHLVDVSRLTVVADLPEIVTGAAPPRPPGRAFFRSVGLGLEDLAIAALLLEAP